MKKYVAILTVLSSCFLQSQGMDVGIYDQKRKEPSTAPVKSVSQISEQNTTGSMVVMPNGGQGAILAPSIPLPSKCGGHFEAGLLYQEMKMGNSEVCVIHGNGGSTRTDPDFLDPFRYNIGQFVDFNMDVGLTAGVAVDFENGWRLLGQTLWLSSTANYTNPPLNSTESLEVVGMVSLYYPQDDDPNNDIATTPLSLGASFQVDFYSLGVNLSNGSYFTKSFTFEPFAGIQATWINYDTIEDYSNFRNDPIDTNLSWVRRVFSSFWGVGPGIGFNANFAIYRGLSIFTTDSFALLLAESRVVNYIGYMTVTAANNIPGFYRYRGVRQHLCPNMRCILGLQYDDRNLISDSFNFRVRGGFDINYYLEQTQTVNRTADFVAGSSTQELDIYSASLDESYFGLVGLMVDFALDF